MKKLICALFFTFIHVVIFAQTWKKLNEQGEKLYEQGKYKEAIETFEKALSQAEKEFGRQDTNYATACDNLGVLYHSQGLYTKAEPVYMQAKEVREKIFGKNHHSYAQSCYNLAMLYEAQGSYSKSELLYLEAIEIYSKVFGKAHADYANCCNNLAMLYYALALYHKAEPLYLEAKEIYSKILGKEHADYASCCNNLAMLYYVQGFYVKAEVLHLEAKTIREKILGKNHPDYAISCNNLALLYESEGLYTKAEALYSEAKSVYAKSFGEEHPDYALACNNLANLYLTQKQYHKAEPLYIKAKDIREKILGKNHPDYAQSCNNLASLYLVQGAYDKSEILYTESKEIWTNLLGKEHPYYAASCSNIAWVYSKQGLYKKAEHLYTESKEIHLRTLGNAHPKYAHSCNNLGKLYWNTQQYTQANSLFQEASQILIKQTQTNFAHLSEKEKEQFLNTFKDNFELYYSYAIQSSQMKELASWLYNNLLVTKGLLFNTTQSIQKTILNSKNEELIKAYYSFISLRKDVAKYSQLSITQREKRKINLDSLETLVNNTEKKLSEKAYTLGIELSEKNYTWQDIQAKLNKDEALVEIIRMRQYDTKKSEFTDSIQYGVFVLKPNQKQPVFFLLPDGNQLETGYTTNYHRSVTGKVQDEDSYNAFWQPVKSYLKDVKKVYFAPDGVYHQISMNTLYNPTTKKYLGEEVQVQLITNGRDVFTLKNKKAQNKKYKDYQIYLFGYPNYKGDKSTNEAKKDSTRTYFTENETRFFDKTGTVSMLPGTKEEVENISNVIQKQGTKPQIYLFNDAKEETIKNLVSPDILHIATHGFFKKNAEKKKESEQYNLFTDNPLNRSGLLLANCEEYLKGKLLSNFTAEDGVLTANECLNLDLHETELVVLSACETGLGEVKNGEGVYGLQRALREAGAKCLIMSLWKVNDQTTQEFMRLLYENMFAKNQSKKEAFKNAQNALRKKYPEPYYWGAFVMIGE